MGVADVHARVEHVTVYASGARVRRVTTIAAPLPRRVRIVGLPLSVIDDTVRVEVGGPAIAVSVRVGVDAPTPATAAAEDSQELRGAKRRAALADAELQRVTSALDVVGASRVIEDDPSDEPPAEWGAILAARKALVALRGERELALREQLAAAKRAADDANRALEATVDREQRSGSARAARLHELRKYVELELTATASDEIVIHIEYEVAAARWAPSYVARIDGDNVRLEVRAVVAQETGEDWAAVPLKLSTAEPARFSLLPELHAQRIGRRQQDPVKAGFRPPPEGAAALYADYQRASVKRRVGAEPEPAPEAFDEQNIASEVWDDGSSRAKERFDTPPEGAAYEQQAGSQTSKGFARSVPAPGAAAAPQFAPMQSAPMPMAKRMDGAFGGRGGAAPSQISAPPVPRLDYSNLRMAPASSPLRGSLVPASPDRHASAIASELAGAKSRIAALAVPPGCVDAWVHTYDYAFETDGAVDVRADAAWHSIAVTQKATTAKLRHVSVPREQADVFRVAAITNPLAGPLLPGPIDVYDRGRFLVTSDVDYTPPGATVEIGLGVDAAVKIARNTEFREEATGMLRGGLRLHHAIAIDVENLSSRAIDLEVRERLPVTREGGDDVEVIVGKIEPAWERWTPDPNAPRDRRLRGGYRWTLVVPPAQKRTLRAAYEVKIAGKHEIVGGNRRES